MLTENGRMILKGLQQGDVIGIVSPSHIPAKEVYAPFYEGIRKAGFKIKEAKHLYADTRTLTYL